MSEITFKERYRPQFHLSAPTGPMSDPNGMVYFDGEYHQFYQFTGRWGHAISRDLLHWEHLPLALDRDDLGDIWSGSAVVDWKDTSGFFNGEAGLVAIFTHFNEGLQSQSIAYSCDKGRTWMKYEGNPVITNPGLKDFRDPKVIWHSDTQKWVMVVSVDKRIHFYSSSNLVEWTFESEFGENQGSHAAVWECPDLFALSVDGDSTRQKWVLHLSIGDNDQTDGSSAQYFVGDFDGRTFLNESSGSLVKWTDYGQDFYAAVSFSDIPKEDGRRIWLAWMSNWKYPFSAPTDPWKGNMSIPRELTLRTNETNEIVLIQQPIDELKMLRGEGTHWDSLEITDTFIPLDVTSISYEFVAEIAWQDIEEFGFRLRYSEKEATLAGYSAKGGLFFLDRTHSGFSELLGRSGDIVSLAKRFTSTRNRSQNHLSIRGFVDASSVELFFDDGECVFSSLIFPDPTSDKLGVYAIGGTAIFKTLSVYPLTSIVHKQKGQTL
ncbi:glycoside hydrolase family 32 protein [Paenibacillus alginolyticus]|uniref:glycoside hydrolase family 32 protein n=1 Tax=Paenibacillus alginolyticus TaxID=59839 RepID=UPI00041467F6|nr:glycoside hydrolase family 32 protein [Paenibacillus alginolyticus]MCY9663549.1 glycoside hydrolase family 32 protein [Paenibacillus alginolyticus]